MMALELKRLHRKIHVRKAVKMSKDFF